MIYKINFFFISYHYFINNLLLYKFFVKFVALKFLILKKYWHTRSLYFCLIDNFLEKLKVSLKKRYKTLGFSSKIKTAYFFKSELFIYKHSKLKIYNFCSIFFKNYIKKNIYLKIRKLKELIYKSEILFVYKIRRGGFLAFSRLVRGILSIKCYCASIQNIIKFKKYFIINNLICVSFFYSKGKLLRLYSTGPLRKFNRIKKNILYKFAFKRFNIVFATKNYYFLKYLELFSISCNSYHFCNSKLVFFSFFLKFVKLLN